MTENLQDIAICDECKSEYYKRSSNMTSLCPECANILYGYPPCNHSFAGGRCVHCYWNGKHSRYILSMIHKT